MEEGLAVDWYLAAPFIFDADDRWLTAYVPNDDRRFVFHPVPATYRHDRSRKVTGLSAWGDYFGHAAAVWAAKGRTDHSSGVLTCFPQLSITVGLRKRISRTRTPIVAWNFNLGALYSGARRHLATFALSAVDRFIVHSRAEVNGYSEWLGLPAERFRFVPLQRATRPIAFEEDRETPFIVSMGSAQRDYRLLFAVLGELGYRTVVVAGPHAVAGLEVPNNVEVRSGLSAEQCYELVQRARISVIPVANRHTASGQVTLLDAMMYARPVIVTECPASVDYVRHGHDALLIQHGEHDDMKAAIKRLWEDDALRAALGQAARVTATEQFCDEAIGRVMGDVLKEVEEEAE